MAGRWMRRVGVAAALALLAAGALAAYRPDGPADGAPPRAAAADPQRAAAPLAQLDPGAGRPLLRAWPGAGYPPGPGTEPLLAAWLSPADLAAGLRAGGPYTAAYLGALAQAGALTPTLLAEVLQAGPAEPGAALLVDRYVALAGPDAAAGLLSRLPGRRLPIVLAEGLRRAPGWSFSGWARAVAAVTPDPALRQHLLYRLDDRTALVAAIDRQGTFRENRELWADWEYMRTLVQTFPDSGLARGARAYAAVRGQPYFAVDRPGAPPWAYGDRQYAPEREIPGFTRWLAEYRWHPEADDAAYRLGRNYEVLGRYLQALQHLLAATELGDGDLADAALGRWVYLLDVVIPAPELAQYDPDALAPPLAAAAEYTRAVRRLRAGRYAEAAGALTGWLERWRGQPPPTLGAGYPLLERVAGQAAQARQLAALQARAGAAAGAARGAALYDLGAVMYHDERLFYNHLWGGQRQQFYARGHINALIQGEATGALAAAAREMNHYYQALQVFLQVLNGPAPADVKARAAYSIGACWGALAEYGVDAMLIAPPALARARAAAAFQAFLERWPRSRLAPGARAALQAHQNQPGPAWSGVPYRDLRAADPALPPGIAAWVRAQVAAGPWAGARAEAGATYVLISRGRAPAGDRLEVTDVQMPAPGELAVGWRHLAGTRIGPAAAPLYRLLRVEGTGYQVQFSSSGSG